MSIPGSSNALFLATAAGGGGGGYAISRSLRFNSSDSAYLSRTPASAGNRKTWTWAGWVKKCSNDTASQYLFATSNSASASAAYIYFNDNNLRYWDRRSSADGLVLVTNAVFRDNSAWFHIVLSVDYGNATSSNRARFFVNGVEQTYSTSSYPSATEDSYVNAATAHYIAAPTQYFNGLLADCYLIDGAALTPSSFTETDATTGQLIPKAFTGSYGTNGFHLEFADNSAATATTLGKDTSGNGNNWTPNNLSVTGILNYSSNVTTVATSIYNGTPATMFDGSTSTYYGVTSSSGNSSISIDLTGKNVSASSTIRVYATFRTGMTWQVNGSTVSSSGVTHPNTGWQTLSGWSTGAITSISNSVPSGNANEIYAIEINGTILINNTGAGNDSLVDVPTNGAQTDTGVGGEVRGNYCTWNPLFSSGNTISNGNLDVTTSASGNATSVGTIGVGSGKWYWEVTPTTATSISIGILKISGTNVELGSTADGYAYLQGGAKYNSGSSTAYGASYTSNDVIGVALDLDAGTLVFYKNNTSQGTAYSSLSGTFYPAVGDYTAGSSVATANFGQRPFAYTAPSGFKALCTANLPAPLVTKPSTVMDVKLYTGNGSTQTISGLGFEPDFVWLKGRSVAYSHQLYDQVRGAGKLLGSNTTNAEATVTDNLTAFTSAGFSLGNDAGTNQSSATYVAWAWDAGSSTVTNTQGSITSSVRANATAGFSIVTFTSNSSGNATVGHGLGVAPSLVILKNRTGGAGNWLVFHKAVCTKDNFLYLNSTNALGTYTDVQGAAIPSSTVFGINAGIGIAGSADCVAYCFAPVAGYSSFGSYTGNGSTDGPFVYTGFRPKWLLIKQSSVGGENWILLDSVRNTYNVLGEYLAPDASAAGSTTGLSDFLSNGFKLRVNTGAATNASGATYIYAAFAESPFNYARAR